MNNEYSTQSCYLHKKSRYCGGGVYDPKCHTALRINAGKIDYSINYLNDRLSTWDYKDIVERQYALVLLLLLKSMYAENSLKMFKIDHGHLHFWKYNF